MTYSIDFRKKVLSFQEAAERFNVGVASIMRWTKQLAPMCTRKKSPTKLPLLALKADCEKYPNSYNYKRAQRLGVGKTTIWRALSKINFTYKKNSKTPKRGRTKTKQIYREP